MFQSSQRIRLIIGAAILLAIVSLMPLSTPSVLAATFTVNNTGDAGDASPGNGVCATSGGVCTLRAAIQENNAGAGSNTISIPAGYTIVLTTNTELLVTKSVTINGGDQSTTIIDGNNATRVFNFQNDSGTHNLSNLTIRNAYYTYAGPYPYLNGGGGIYNEATLTLSNVTLSNNRATQGGGVFNAYASGPSDPTPPALTLNSVTLGSNTATSTTQGQGGGGLFNGSLLTTNGVTITNNTAGYQGGGIYINSYYAVNLSNFTISSNTAKMGGGISNEIDQSVNLITGTLSSNVSNCCDVGGIASGGGGIVNNDGAMTLTNVTLSGNTATSTGGYGGGIVNIQRMTLTNVTLSGNGAQYGAGIYNGASASNAMTLTNVTISGNTHSSPSAGGGGIWNTTYGNLNLTNATITQNNAAQSGGIQNLATVTLRNTILAGNTSTSGYPVDCAGTLTSGGYNLIGNTSGCTFVSSTGDLLNTNPLLGPLQNNGGSTNTHALSAGSPAIDAVMSGCPPPSTDQRGITRPRGLRCDMGAYETTAHSITSLDPALKRAGSPGFTLTVNGTNFQSGFIIQWNGANRTTNFVSSTQLTTSINASDVATAAGVPVTVLDPGPNGGTSNTKIFLIFDHELFLPFIRRN